MYFNSEIKFYQELTGNIEFILGDIVELLNSSNKSGGSILIAIGKQESSNNIDYNIFQLKKYIKEAVINPQPEGLITIFNFSNFIEIKVKRGKEI